MKKLLTANEEKLDALYLNFVSARPVWCEDAAETKLGELVRAVTGIWYQFHWMDNMISFEDPVQDLNSIARFICSEYAGTKMDEIVSAMWNLKGERMYDMALDMLIGATVDYIEDHWELEEEANDADCLDFYEVADMPKEDEEFGDHTIEWQEQEDLKMYPARSC